MKNSRLSTESSRIRRMRAGTNENGEACETERETEDGTIEIVFGNETIYPERRFEPIASYELGVWQAEQLGSHLLELVELERSALIAARAAKEAANAP